MAGKAAKKAAKASATTANLYFPIIIGVNTVHVLFRVLYHFRSFGLWQAMGMVFTSVIYYVCYQGVVEAARMDAPAGAYFDILVITLLAQAVSTVSSSGWYIFLLVPAYYVSVLSNWAFRQLQASVTSQPGEENTTISERELKRQAKKERKAARGPRMKIR